MAAVVVIGDEHGLSVEERRGNQTNKSKLLLISHYFHFNILFKHLHTSNKTERFSYKGVCGVCGRMCIEIFKRRAGLGYRLMSSDY